MLLCLSADYRRTPIPLLEHLERRSAEITRSLAEPGFARGSVIVATCNRFEAYLDLREGDPDASVGRIAEAAGVETAELSEALGVHTDELAAEHLFAVACGLESAAVGEGEIAGQVRRAHSAAHRGGTVSDPLERLFQSAHRVSRDVKNRTGIQGEGRSLVRLGRLLAERRIESWAQARVLLIGTGAYAGATVAALNARGAQRIAVHSPSGRAAAFADARGIGAVPPEGFGHALATADLLIACSSVSDPLITAPDLARLEARPRLLLDLGMPRNVDPAVGSLDGVELLDIDAIARHAPIPELSAGAEARRLVREAAVEFAASQAEREALPTLVTLREHVLGLLEDELCRARRGPRAEQDGDAGSSTEIESALRRFTGRLLHEPSERIRALGRAGRADEARSATAALFGIGADA